MSILSQPTLKNRMNSSQDKEKIYMLEDCDDFCKSKIKEAQVIPNSINIYQNRITVEYFDYMNGTEEKEFYIKDLKQIFYFVKIINQNDMEGNEINFLVLKEQPYNSINLIHDEENEILEKINNKACLGNKIKKILNIDEFPLENYYLKKEEANICSFDKVYSLIKKQNNIININSSENGINSYNIFNNNNNNSINSNNNNYNSINNNFNNHNNYNSNNNNYNSINNNYNYNNNKELIEKIEIMENSMKKINNRLDGIENQLNEILNYVRNKK